MELLKTEEVEIVFTEESLQEIAEVRGVVGHQYMMVIAVLVRRTIVAGI